MKKNKYLPIGSVVILKEGELKVMITGRQQVRTTDNTEFDYVGCLYPQGTDGENVLLFNAEDIVLVVFIGYQDLDELHYKFTLIGEDGEDEVE
ncbi:DUF4176 domain-containing protein [Jutongia hominis]|uniref:DUF4176 domain-containing protein n=1 Tax=Jutongia hominis TaxID=2763664 RepID=A0ABR7MUJ3_9FIRM|nr:DUF4176 domain-containing protein [Jutongia hominis]MBC8557478.1 DUF4176 domain-containing protein [Jutongia hominis]